MNKKFIRKVLEDYLQALYRGGTEEAQNEVSEAIRELEKENCTYCKGYNDFVKKEGRRKNG